jgi:hypothetical protein
MFIKNRMFMQPLFNAEGGSGGSDPNAGGAGSEGGQGAEGGQGGEPEKRFTQAELDAIIKDRLAKEKRKADEKADEARKEAERKALEEQGKYKEMYEQLQKDLEAEKGNALANKKQALLVAEGYTKEQAEKYVKFIEGATDEELATSIATFKEDVPPKGTQFADPASAGNGKKQDPTPTSAYDEAKELIKRLRGKK